MKETIFDDQTALKELFRHINKHPSILDDGIDDPYDLWQFIRKTHDKSHNIKIQIIVTEE